MSRYQVQQRLMFPRDCLRLSSLSVIVLGHVVTHNRALFFSHSLHVCLSFYVILSSLFFTDSSFVNYSFSVASQFVAFFAIFLADLVVICYRSVIVVDYIPVFVQKDAWRSRLLTAFQTDVRCGTNKDRYYKTSELHRNSDISPAMIRDRLLQISRNTINARIDVLLSSLPSSLFHLE